MTARFPRGAYFAGRALALIASVLTACSSTGHVTSPAPQQPALTVGKPPVDFCEPIAAKRFSEFVDAFNHRNLAAADQMITSDEMFWGFAESPDRPPQGTKAGDRGSVRTFLQSRADVGEVWTIEQYEYDSYQGAARPGSFISFAIRVSNAGGTTTREGKGFVHCATDKIDLFVLGPTTPNG